MTDKATKTKGWQDSANKRRTRSLIGNGLLALFEIYDDIPISQHVIAILRSRGKRGGEPTGLEPTGPNKYSHMYLEDQVFLKELETYSAELQKIKLEGEE